ncbi:hypothetical protein HUT03_04660 [Candidatus Liberibacter africanus]|uniref:Phage-associated protein n=1 Tax=Candidatus Liberibacter africanus PTSAPSY TaxID=1277257 RepID=A0A0G3I5K0_LIBAF|nr:hypothetical protein [Candidatus Liberibacter africanus]AKK20530.1 phage-associated protein [Candidatus Liberibacter africanus PTSAPSY]QTP64237.1 hypothetical protein HUT03_04660 [Candidatus Liberibacter africanus]
MLDEEPQAWRDGSVFAGIYHRLKFFDNIYPEVEYLDGKIRLPVDLAFDMYHKICDKNIIDIMDDIWNRYKEYSEDELYKIVTEKERAWYKIGATDRQDLVKIITVDDILKYETKY